MKIAIPVWNDRISPVFDTSKHLLVVEFSGEGETSRREHVIEELFPPVRVRRLKETGADLLICGAISNMIGNLIEAEGICIIPWVSGGVEEVLDAFAHEDLTDARYRMPGCRGRGMGYRRGRDRGTWGGPERGSLRGGRCGRRRQGELKQDQGESK